jgi:hypothetical protein
MPDKIYNISTILTKVPEILENQSDRKSQILFFVFFGTIYGCKKKTSYFYDHRPYQRRKISTNK